MWRLVPAAVAVLVIISLGMWYQQLHRDSLGPGETAINLPSPTAEFAALVPLEPAPVQLPLDALLVRRDSGADEHTLYIRKLAHALAPYRTGGYAQAAPGLAQVADAYPNAPEAQFYYGICLLFIDQPGEAIHHLSKENLFVGTQWQRKASWYRGIAYLRAGNSAAAMHEFQRLCESEGETRESACEAARRVLTATRNPAGR